MNPAHTLNTWKARTWAQVAQAVTWDDYALNSDGQVTVKATGGPVIVWGRRTGEGEDVPRLEAPTPSPLEVEAARVNLAPCVQRCLSMAQGRRRNAEGRRVGFKKLWDKINGKLLRLYRSNIERRKPNPDLDYYSYKRLGKEIIVDEWYYYELRYIFPVKERIGIAPHRIDIFCVDEEWLDSSLELTSKIISYYNDDVALDYWYLFESPRYGRPIFELNTALSLAILERDMGAIRALMWALRKLRATPGLSNIAAIKDIQAESFRAHIARRVRPVSKRARVPRPLYARPRPPTCPLAPPVA